MKNKKLITILIVFIFILVIGIMYANINKKNKENNGEFRILTTFYPIYVMTLNITDGVENVKVSNMAEKNTGCIHDYTLSTEDLKKFEKTNVLIENGKGLESFLDKITNSYPQVKIIESGRNVNNIITDEDEENAHIWLNLENYISQVNTISSELQKLNPANKDIYIQNAEAYAHKLTNLKLQYENINFEEEKQAICLNEALSYLLDEVGINATVIETDHEQTSLSADTIKNLIDVMNRKNIKIIFIDKNDNTKTAQSLANETGAKIYCLDSAMNGSSDKDDYIKAMEYNYNVLRNM